MTKPFPEITSFFLLEWCLRVIAFGRKWFKDCKIVGFSSANQIWEKLAGLWAYAGHLHRLVSRSSCCLGLPGMLYSLNHIDELPQKLCMLAHGPERNFCSVEGNAATANTKGSVSTSAFFSALASTETRQVKPNVKGRFPQPFTVLPRSDLFKFFRIARMLRFVQLVGIPEASEVDFRLRPTKHELAMCTLYQTHYYCSVCQHCFESFHMVLEMILHYFTSIERFWRTFDSCCQHANSTTATIYELHYCCIYAFIAHAGKDHTEQTIEVKTFKHVSYFEDLWKPCAKWIWQSQWAFSVWGRRLVRGLVSSGGTLFSGIELVLACFVESRFKTPRIIDINLLRFA